MQRGVTAGGHIENATATNVENSNIGLQINFATRLHILFTFRKAYITYSIEPAAISRRFSTGKTPVELATIFNRLNGNAKSGIHTLS